MATIRVREWTKQQLDRIRSNESHSSHDSVIKSLLRDRELARLVASPETTPPTEHTGEPEPERNGEFGTLTVLAELTQPQNGVLFLWCPNCGNEVVHLTTESTIDISVLEIDCQSCLSPLDHHSIVAIDVDYPLEQKIVDGSLENDLQHCVIDYWDRTLSRIDSQSESSTSTPEELVWKFDNYHKMLLIEWPESIPVVSFEPDTVYRDLVTDQLIRVDKSVTENRNRLDSFEVRRYDPSGDPAATTPEIIDSAEVTNLLLERRLVIEA
ncbi:hypothetical protein [Halocatena halophila]|uniref:hypothetical protein n=1 Tax=Halocatena halophila TaxID=2814576 RepID=UPI002ED1E03E